MPCPHRNTWSCTRATPRRVSVQGLYQPVRRSASPPGHTFGSWSWWDWMRSETCLAESASSEPRSSWAAKAFLILSSRSRWVACGMARRSGHGLPRTAPARLTSKDQAGATSSGYLSTPPTEQLGHSLDDVGSVLGIGTPQGHVDNDDLPGNRNTEDCRRDLRTGPSIGSMLLSPTIRKMPPQPPMS